MNTKTTFAVLAVLAVLAVVTAITTSALQQASAVGVPMEKSFGKCKQDKGGNACEANKDRFTGSDK
jgi:hypothetical protein